MEEATILLVDGLHGINAGARMFEEYGRRLYIEECSGQARAIMLDDLEHLDEIVADGDLTVKLNNGQSWRVEFNDGDIIAVNPSAEWCDSCEQWELVPDNVATYQVLSVFLPALINADNTGLEDDEIPQLDNFEKRETEGLSNFHWNANTDHIDDFGECEITGLRGQCVELHLVNMSEVNV